MIQKRKQEGFGVVIVIFLLIILAAVAAAGWYVLQQSSKNTEEGSGQTRSSTTNKWGSSTTGSTTAAPYLEIKELGLKLKLTDATKDMTYAVQNGKVVLSGVALSKAAPRCAADYPGSDANNFYGIGSIGYYTDPKGYDQSPAGYYTNEETWPNAVNINGRYYFIATHQMTCTPQGGTESQRALESVLVSAIRNNQITIEKL